MKKSSLFFFMVFVLCNLNAQWYELPSNINDNLNGIAALGDNMVVSGEGGLYYQLEAHPNDWIRFEITNNPEDALIYEHTKFNHCIPDPQTSGNNGDVYACGVDMNTNQAVIFKLEIPSLSYEIIYQGKSNSELNQLAYNDFYHFFGAVGNDGLLLWIKEGEIREIDTNNNDDYLSVSFDRSDMRLGIADKVALGVLNNTTSSMNLEIVNTPGFIHAAVTYTDSQRSSSVGTGYTTYSTTSGYSENRNYDYGPLNGQAIILIDNLHYVGTDHGIFKNSRWRSTLEWQPSSEDHHINNFFYDEDNNTLYACGKNGIILQTQNKGGSTIPYVKLSGLGTCIDTRVEIELTRGSSEHCSWIVDGQPINHHCDDLDYFFDEPGTYTIEVTGENEFGEQSSASIDVLIVDPPAIDLPVTIEDSILCKSEPVVMQISNTETNVRYVLKKAGDSGTYGISQVGTGGEITFVSNEITISGEYYLVSQHILVNCKNDFKDRFYLHVEQTSADFAGELINASPGEEIRFSETTTDAHHFNWSFSSGASLSTSSQPFITTSFANHGDTEVQLVAWSDHGCYDTVRMPGPYIVDESIELEACWSLVNAGGDPLKAKQESGQRSSGYTDAHIMDLTQTEHGFLACGIYNNDTFSSKRGRSIHLPFQGGYLSQYNYDGTLKWNVHTVNNSSDGNIIYSTSIDANGNIYLVGDAEGTFYDNFGNSVELTRFYSSGSIIKLSSRGELIWHMEIEHAYPKRIHIDQNNNLVVVGRKRIVSSSPVYLNHELVDTLDALQPNLMNNYFLAKFDADGNRIWDTSFFMKSNNSHFIREVKTDKSDNIYLMGYFESVAKFYSAGDTQENVLEVPTSTAGNGTRIVLSKFNPQGMYDWAITSYVTNNVNTSSTGFGLDVDEDGNCYVSGTNDALFPDDLFTFFNTDGSETVKSVGSYYLAKVNTHGVCQWISGAAHSKYGYGYRTLILEDEICAIAQVSDSGFEPVEVEFLSADDKSFTMTLQPSDYALVFYDFDGNLNRVVTNGVNEKVLYVSRFSDIFKGPGDDYYIASILGFYYGFSTYENFGHTISGLIGIDGVISKVQESCGIIKYSSVPLDTDMDGFLSDVDCDDQNASVNPDAMEIANNDIDENCDGELLIIDEDGDGYNSDEDCDDQDSSINPGAMEIANNAVDEDCDGEALIIDEDGDGYNSDEDCDDQNASVNPDAMEIANNDIDENCDGELLIIDEDGDGYNSDEDCDDNNEDIYPGAEEIPDNGIDEDCDGEDDVTTAIFFLDDNKINVYPNPATDHVFINKNINSTIITVLYDNTGLFVRSYGDRNELDVEDVPRGIYLLIFENWKTGNRVSKKLLLL
ncbi:MAG: MopE-related protein [Bacteroidota bacterium]